MYLMHTKLENFNYNLAYFVSDDWTHYRYYFVCVFYIIRLSVSRANLCVFEFQSEDKCVMSVTVLYVCN